MLADEDDDEPNRRPTWVEDTQVKECKRCAHQFGPFLRKHHCRNCGDIYCNNCSSRKIRIKQLEYKEPVRVCHFCYEMTVIKEALLTNRSSDDPISLTDWEKIQISTAKRMLILVSEETQHLKLIQLGLLKVINHLVKQYLKNESIQIYTSKVIHVLTKNASLSTMLLEEREILSLLLAHEHKDVVLNSCVAVATLASKLGEDTKKIKILSKSTMDAFTEITRVFDTKEIQLKIGEVLFEMSVYEDFVKDGGMVPFLNLALSEDEDLQLLIISIIGRLFNLGLHKRLLLEGGLFPILSLLSSKGSGVLLGTIKILRKIIDEDEELGLLIIKSGLFTCLTPIVGDCKYDDVVMDAVRMIEAFSHYKSYRNYMVKNRKLLQHLNELVTTKKNPVLILSVLNIVHQLSSDEEFASLIRQLDFIKRADSLQKVITLDPAIQKAVSTVLASFK